MFAIMKIPLACFLVLWIGGVSGDGLTAVEQRIRSDPDLTEFYELLQRSPLSRVSLQYKQVTIFAPRNTAFQQYGKAIDVPDEVIPYHITSVPKKTDQLGTSYTSLFSELTGSPILWVTHTTGTYHDDIYINNARVLISQSNIQVMQNSNEQIIHKIDEVLFPTRSATNAPNRVYNPTAWEFLESYESLIMGDHRVRSFRQRVQATNKEDIFKTEGGHTFFIPVDEGFKADRAAAVDGKVIDGHVIPRQVLFTAPTGKDVPFPTLANSDNDIRVLISFTEEIRGKRVVHYVKSHTLLGDGRHTAGVVLAEIVKPNIPVKNGVIHLIQKPLMIVDNSVKELLLENQGGILSKFVTAINSSGAIGVEFFNRLNHGGGQVTLFAPCNAAWDSDLALNKLIEDTATFKDILDMHLVVDDKLYVEKIINNRQMKVYQYPSLNKRQLLYFNVVTVGNNRTVTVEAGGVNATVLQADLAATNGIIHVIDRVLGVPYSTILDKLEQDHMLNLTFQLGMRRGFNNLLNDTSKTKKYTYFVPSDRAWKEASVRMPSTHKVIFMPEYSYHTNNILERHLVISDEVYTMDRIRLLSNETSQNHKFKREVNLPTIRGGSLSIYVEKPYDRSPIIHWNGEKIPVFRADVECTNGIIHVIDLPFLQESDIKISGASIVLLTNHILILVVATCLII